MADDWTANQVKSILDDRVNDMHELLREKDRRYEQMFRDQKEATNLALSAAQLAVSKAEAAAEKRFDSVNEFRQVLSDQTASFVTRREILAVITVLCTIMIATTAVISLLVFRK
jgi:hypothetical protein